MSTTKALPDVVVAGSVAIDFACDYKSRQLSNESDSPLPYTSNPARIRQSLGGVANNITTALQYLGTNVLLCSAVGDDPAGSAALAALSKRGLDCSGIVKSPKGISTAQYVAVNDSHKDLVLGMADMDILEDDWASATFDHTWGSYISAHKPKWLVVDACWSLEALQKWIMAGKAIGSSIAFEPVSITKSKKILEVINAPKSGSAVVPDHLVNLVTPNQLELAALHSRAREMGLFDREDWWRIVNAMGMSSAGSHDRLVSITNNMLVDEGIPQQSIQLLPFMPCILTKLGDHGLLLTQLLRPGHGWLTEPSHARYILSRSTDSRVGGVYMRWFPPVETVPKESIVSVSGIGDTFVGVLLAGLAKSQPKDIAQLVDIAQKGSVLTLKSEDTVCPSIASLGREL